MAMTQENVRALEQLRQRVLLLKTSITSVQENLGRSEAPPTWPSLQSSAQALSFNLQQLSDTFQSHRQFLKEAHAYPLPHFPGNTQEGLLGELLRKKLEPGAEDWVDSYTTKFSNQENDDGGWDRSELNELWTWAASASAGIVRPMLEEDGAFEDDFTIAEREAGVEKVVTGLRRKLDGQDEEDEDGEDEVDGDRMEDVVPASTKESTQEAAGFDTSLPAMPIENMLKFAGTGVLPANSSQPNR